MSVANGAIEGLDLPLLVAKAQEGEIGNWRREAGRRTPFERLDANFTIVNGIAETSDLTLYGAEHRRQRRGQDRYSAPAPGIPAEDEGDRPRGAGRRDTAGTGARR